MFPGRSAARSEALQTRDRYTFGVCEGPGSAVHHFVLHRIRETAPFAYGFHGRVKPGLGVVE